MKLKDGEIRYQDVPIETVMRFFTDGFCTKDKHETILRTEWFLDSSKGVVIFKHIVEYRLRAGATPPKP